MGDAEGSPKQRTGVVAERMEECVVEGVYERRLRRLVIERNNPVADELTIKISNTLATIGCVQLGNNDGSADNVEPEAGSLLVSAITRSRQSQRAQFWATNITVLELFITIIDIAVAGGIYLL
jgi:hypothetical protein